jgi:hypothetical protein
MVITSRIFFGIDERGGSLDDDRGALAAVGFEGGGIGQQLIDLMLLFVRLGNA